MELWDVFDKNRNFTGRIIQREKDEPLTDDEYTLFVRAAFFNDQDEMLIQKRQSNNSIYPNLWDFTCTSHQLSGETSQEAIARAMTEELGLNLNFDDDIPNITIVRPHVFTDYYVVKNIEIDINNIRISGNHVQSITWANKDEIFQLIDEGKFVNYTKSLIDFLFFLKNSNGAVINNGN